MIIMLKGKVEFRDIGLAEVIWKLFNFTIKNRLHSATTLNDALHGLRQGWGNGTATLEVKLAQNITGIYHDPLFQVFLDMRKAYNYLYRKICMEVFRGYGLGPKLGRLITRFWA